jgi:hypothetical protein
MHYHLILIDISPKITSNTAGPVSQESTLNHAKMLGFGHSVISSEFLAARRRVFMVNSLGYLVFFVQIRNPDTLQWTVAPILRNIG